MVDNSRKLLIALILVIVIASGCASRYSVAKNDALSEYREDEKIATEVAQRVANANDLFISGDYRGAEREYNMLLNEYSSTDGSFETAVLTNICMCYLETGERKRFKDCAGKLKKVSAGLSYISRETQMVIELDNILYNSTEKGEDLRIESRISRGLKEIFKEGGRR